MKINQYKAQKLLKAHLYVSALSRKHEWAHRKYLLWQENIIIQWSDKRAAAIVYTTRCLRVDSYSYEEVKLQSSYHISPLTLEVVGAPQTTLQQYRSFLPCFSLPSGNLQTPFPSVPWCYLPISSSVFLSFLLFSLSLAELSSPCQRILRCGHTIWVSVSLQWLGDHHALQLHSGFCCEPPRSSHGLCRKCSEVSYSISSQCFVSFSLFPLSRSSSHRHKGR